MTAHPSPAVRDAAKVREALVRVLALSSKTAKRSLAESLGIDATQGGYLSDVADALLGSRPAAPTAGTGSDQ